jgi:hypothetical protein
LRRIETRVIDSCSFDGARELENYACEAKRDGKLKGNQSTLEPANSPEVATAGLLTNDFPRLQSEQVQNWSECQEARHDTSDSHGGNAGNQSNLQPKTGDKPRACR